MANPSLKSIDPVERGAAAAEERKLSRAATYVFNWHLLGYGTWLFPLIMMAVGYSTDGQLRQHASIATLESVALHLLFSVIIGLVWIAIQVKLATSRKTPISSLQFDSSLATLLITGSSVALGIMLNAGTLGWWFVTPYVLLFVDALTSSNLGINNAATRRSINEDRVDN
jgi:positive regulator of sigma E activity